MSEVKNDVKQKNVIGDNATPSPLKPKQEEHQVCDTKPLSLLSMKENKNKKFNLRLKKYFYIKLKKKEFLFSFLVLIHLIPSRTRRFYLFAAFHSAYFAFTRSSK